MIAASNLNSRAQTGGFADTHPYWFVAIMELVVILVYLLAGTVNHFLGRSNLFLYGLANLGLAVILAILLTAMRWWRELGFEPRTGQVISGITCFRCCR